MIRWTATCHAAIADSHQPCSAPVLQQVLKANHTVTMRKVEGEWKVVTFVAEFVGAYDPMSGVEITPFGLP